MHNITRVNIRGCKFSRVEITIVGRDAEKRRCCSDVTLKKSRLSYTRLFCRKVSLEIVGSKFRVSDDSMMYWTSYHGSRFTAVNATFNTSNAQGAQALLSVSRKNAVMENVQLLCPVKVTASLTEPTKYNLLCTTQCIHNEYKVRNMNLELSSVRIKLVDMTSNTDNHLLVGFQTSSYKNSHNNQQNS